MTHQKKIVVNVNITFAKDNRIKAKMKALHNGSFLIEKHQFTGNKQNVYNVIESFINRHNADSISMSRSVLNDEFVKHYSALSASLKEERIDEIADAIGEELLEAFDKERETVETIDVEPNGAEIETDNTVVEEAAEPEKNPNTKRTKNKK